MANKMDVRSNLAEIFLKSMEEQPLSWNKNFRSAKRPVNGIYKNKYKGYNRMLLSYVMNQKGYQDPRFYPQSYIFGSPENKGKEWDDPTKIKVIKGEHPHCLRSFAICTLCFGACLPCIQELISVKPIGLCSAQISSNTVKLTSPNPSFFISKFKMISSLFMR